MILSFSWTTPALLAGVKTVTRRDWKVSHAVKFTTGEIVDAWDRSPRAHGRRVADIRLNDDAHLDSTSVAPESDYKAEGFAYLEERGITLNGMTPRELWDDWHDNPRDLYEVRFDPVKTCGTCGKAIPAAEPDLLLPCGNCPFCCHDGPHVRIIV